MADTVARIIISAKDIASAGLKKIADSIRSVGDAAEKSGGMFKGVSLGLKEIITLGGAAFAISKVSQAFQKVGEHSAALNASLKSLSGEGTLAMQSFSDRVGEGMAMFTDMIKSGLANATRYFNAFADNVGALGQWIGSALSGDMISWGEALSYARERTEDAAKANRALEASLDPEKIAAAKEAMKEAADHAKRLAEGAVTASVGLQNIGREIARQNATPLEAMDIDIEEQVAAYAKSLGEYANTEKGKQDILNASLAIRMMAEDKYAKEIQEHNRQETADAIAARAAEAEAAKAAAAARAEASFNASQRIAQAEVGLLEMKRSMNQSEIEELYTRKQEILDAELAHAEAMLEVNASYEENLAALRAEHRLQEEALEQERFEREHETMLALGDAVSSSMEQTLSTSLVQLLNHSTSLSEIAKTTIKNLEAALISSLVKMGIEKLKQFIIEKAMSKSKQVGEVSTAAGVGFANMFASWAGAPWPLSMMAPAMAAQASAQILAGGMASAAMAEGGFVPMLPGADASRDSVLTMLQPGELVIPKSFASEIRGMQAGGVVGGGSVAGSDAGGASGGGGVVNVAILPTSPTVIAPMLRAMSDAVERFGHTLVASEVRA